MREKTKYERRKKRPRRERENGGNARSNVTCAWHRNMPGATAPVPRTEAGGVTGVAKKGTTLVGV